MSTASDRTCPICHHRFDTVADREAHVPCPEQGDERIPCRHQPAGHPHYGLGGPDRGNRKEYAVSTCSRCGEPIYQFVVTIPGARNSRWGQWQVGTPRDFERY